MIRIGLINMLEKYHIHPYTILIFIRDSRPEAGTRGFKSHIRSAKTEKFAEFYGAGNLKDEYAFNAHSLEVFLFSQAMQKGVNIFE